MIPLEELKDMLALYDECYSHNKIVKLSGYPSAEVTRIYHDMVMSRELLPRKERLLKNGRRGQIVSIDPVTFECNVYNSIQELKELGFLIPNVLTACKEKTKTCSGKFWRFISEIDLSDVEGCLKDEFPELFIPLVAISLDGEETRYFETLQYAIAEGFLKQKITMCLEGKLQSYKGYIWKEVKDNERLESDV